MSYFKLLCLTTVVLSSGYIYAEETPTEKIEVSGNITVVSAYVSRGLTNAVENDDISIQPYLSASYKNAYVAYWGSPLNYSFKEIQDNIHNSSYRFEHNLIAGYLFDYAGLSFDLWDAFYYYPSAKDGTSNELGLRVTKTFADESLLTLGASVFLYDVIYMNQGDLFISADYIKPLSDKWNLALGLGFSSFQDNGKFEGNDFLNTQKDFVWRYASAQLDYSINDSTSVFYKYIIGGEDRSGIAQKNKGVIGLTYVF